MYNFGILHIFIMLSQMQIIKNLINDYLAVSESLLASNTALVAEARDAISRMEDADDDYEYTLYSSILNHDVKEMDINIGAILYANKSFVEMALNDRRYESTLNRTLARLSLFSVTMEGKRTLNFDWDQTDSNKHTIVNLKNIGYIAYVNELSGKPKKDFRLRFIDIDNTTYTSEDL